jgi:hypothetical protein
MASSPRMIWASWCHTFSDLHTSQLNIPAMGYIRCSVAFSIPSITCAVTPESDDTSHQGEATAAV